MQESRPVTTPMSRDMTIAYKKPQDCHPQKLGRFHEVIEALMYLSTSTGSDVATAFNVPARDSAAPADASSFGVKRALRYPRGRKGLGLFSKKGAGNRLPEMGR